MEMLNAALVIAALIIGTVVFWLVLQVRRSTAPSESQRRAGQASAQDVEG